jgi:hypothetical protein
MDWISITTLVFSAGSLLVSLSSALIAKSSLEQAKLAVEQERLSVEQARMDWAQRKWYDLYFKANQAYNSLEEFQMQYHQSNPAAPSTQQQIDFNELMLLFRETHSMASVFPKNPQIDALFASTTFGSGIVGVLPKERLHKLFDALELLRNNSLLDPNVLRPFDGESRRLT